MIRLLDRRVRFSSPPVTESARGDSTPGPIAAKGGPPLPFHSPSTIFSMAFHRFGEPVFAQERTPLDSVGLVLAHFWSSGQGRVQDLADEIIAEHTGNYTSGTAGQPGNSFKNVLPIYPKYLIPISLVK